MGIARRRDGRPATYRRNDSYFRWKRVESLANEHDPAELRRRVDDLIGRDRELQDRYDVPDPDAVGTAATTSAPASNSGPGSVDADAPITTTVAAGGTTDESRTRL